MGCVLPCFSLSLSLLLSTSQCNILGIICSTLKHKSILTQPPFASPCSRSAIFSTMRPRWPSPCPWPYGVRTADVLEMKSSFALFPQAVQCGALMSFHRLVPVFERLVPISHPVPGAVEEAAGQACVKMEGLRLV